MKRRSAQIQILIVEDDEITAAFISNECHRNGFETVVCSEGAQIWNVLTDGVCAVLLDLGLPDEDGLDVIREVRRRFPKLPVFVVTADHSAASAVEALKSGAIDYFTKPIQTERLMESLKHSIALTSELGQPLVSDSGLFWKSAGMRRLQRLIGKASRSSSPALIVGEQGAGKQEVASAIHFGSARRAQPFVVYNLAVETAQQVEADLFGVESGVSKTIQTRGRGKMEIASSGSLFINDADLLPLTVQLRIREVLETGRFSRMGSEVRQRVDFKLIFGWSTDLEEVVVPTGFDADLFYRISALFLRIPALRERREDIPTLCEQYITQICIANHFRRPEIASQAMSHLVAYSWPGNLVELKSALEHAVSVAEGRMIDLRDLPEYIKSAERPDYDSVIRNIGGATITELERLSLVEALEFCNGNRRKVALRLGVSLRTVYNLMERHGIQKGIRSTDEKRD